jgi:predicted transcriptional regulator
LRTAALVLFHYEISGAPVVDADDTLIGVLSESDLLDKAAGTRLGFGRAAAASERRRTAETVGQACTRPARVTSPDVTVREAATEMRDCGVAMLVVVDDSRIVGVVTRHDILKTLIRTDAELREAVEARLAEFGEPEVRATVEWGAVTLEGTASVRSRTRTLVATVESIDGVTTVQGDALDWHVDDVSPIPDHPLL